MGAIDEPASSLNRPEPPLREPHLFRFGLQRLFVAASSLVVLCGVVRLAPWGVSSAVLALAALLAAHFLGAILGTRLRNSSADVQQWMVARGLERPRDAADVVDGSQRVEPPRATPLAGHEGASPRRGKLSAVLGLVLGGALGTAGILAVGGDEITWLGVAIVAFSCGVLAAWSAMLASGFWVIGRRAWKDAARAERR